MIIKPKHTLGSVAQQIIDGLEDGTVVVDPGHIECLHCGNSCCPSCYSGDTWDWSLEFENE